MPIFLIIFVPLALIIALGVAIASWRGRAKRRAQLIAMISGASSDAKDSADKGKAERTAELARKLKAAGQETRDSKKPSLAALIAQAGFHTPLPRFWIYSTLTAAFAFIILHYGTGIAMPVKLLFTVFALLGLPRLYLKRRAARRQKEFIQAFPDALDGMVRLLKAGMPVIEAIKMVGNEFAGPMGDEMKTLYEEQSVGVNLPEAAGGVARRMPLPEVQMFATGVAIQSETGSSLSEVLSNLSTVIRARFRLKLKVKALSSEAKASATIIGALPIFVCAIMYWLQPSYMGLMFEERAGRIMLYGCGIWMGIGMLVMRQIINFKV